MGREHVKQPNAFVTGKNSLAIKCTRTARLRLPFQKSNPFISIFEMQDHLPPIYLVPFTVSAAIFGSSIFWNREAQRYSVDSFIAESVHRMLRVLLLILIRDGKGWPKRPCLMCKFFTVLLFF